VQITANPCVPAAAAAKYCVCFAAEAPQFGRAKDPVNLAGLVASNISHSYCWYLLFHAAAAEAPQFGSAKDPVNLAGMVASNVMRGDHPVEHWDSVDWPAVRADPTAVIVDVREVSLHVLWCIYACNVSLQLLEHVLLMPAAC
jgi:hypothetical protein